MRLLIVGKHASSSMSPLRDSRFIAEQADTADEALSLLRQGIYDLVVLLMGSLRQAGFDLIPRIRGADNDTPLLALTGSRVADRVRALDLGADDAMAEPVDSAEFRARLSAIVRRSRGFSKSLLQVGDLSLCLTTRNVTFGALPIKLTDKEYLALELLILRKGLVLTKEAFLDHLYGGLDEPDSQIIDLFIYKLRKKLGRAGGDDLISTVWGRGYMIRDNSGFAHHPSDLASRAGQQELVH